MSVKLEIEIRKFLSEYDLQSYNVMIVDEAHKRTLHTDILFSLVKEVIIFRPDLKLLISKNTLDSQKFTQFLMILPFLEYFKYVFLWIYITQKHQKPITLMSVLYL